METSRKSNLWDIADCYEAVLFDLDGTIADTDFAHGAAYKSAFAEIGISVSENSFRQYSGEHSSAVIRGLSRGDTTIDASSLHERKTHYFLELAPIFVKPLPLLGLARALQGVVPIALVTSASRRTAVCVLDCLKTRVNFDLIVTADEVVSQKPDPEPYIQACKSLRVTPSNCLAFEDSSSGLLAARAAGLAVVKIQAEPPVGV